MLTTYFSGLVAITFLVFLALLPVYERIWSPYRLLLAVCVPSFVAVKSVHRDSLTPSAAAVALFVGFMLTSCSYVHMITMLAFFFPSVLISKAGRKLKQQLVLDEHDIGREGESHAGQSGRTWSQVIANGGVQTWFAIMSVLESRQVGLERPVVLDSEHYWSSWFDLVIFGASAFAAGDTWASELGILSSSSPALITTWRKVPPGTNGAISLPGVVFSAAGGLSVGLAHYLAVLIFSDQFTLQRSPCQRLLLLTGALSGVCGSLIDSLLGATLQYSGFDPEEKRVVPYSRSDEKPIVHICGSNVMSNDGVNLLSAVITGLLTPHFAEYIWRVGGCI